MAVIEVVALGLVLLVIVLVVGIFTGAFGGKSSGTRSTPSVAVVRLAGFKDGHEELQLRVNDQLIRRISDQGLRPADYQAQVQEVEQLASSLAAALNIEVWLRRADVRDQPGWPTRSRRKPERLTQRRKDQRNVSVRSLRLCVTWFQDRWAASFQPVL